MMKNFKSALLILTTIALAGCLPAVSSIHPFYSSDEAIDESLLGTWNSADEEKDVFIIERKDSTSYLFSEFDTEKNAKREGYGARFVKVGEAAFFNFENAKPQDAGDLMIAVHTFMKAEIKGDTLTLTPIDANKLQALIDIDARFKLDFIHPSDDELLITSPTSRLQEVMALAVSENKDIFGDPVVLERKNSGLF